MAFQIIIHTFRMIFGNFGQALRVSVGPYLIAFAVAYGLAYAVGFPIFIGDQVVSQISIPNGNWFLLPLVLVPLIIFVIAWVAVSWHRFILREEYAGLLPAVKDRPIWRYAGKSILLGLLLAIIAMPILSILSSAMARDVTDAIGSSASLAIGELPDLSMAFQSKWLLINALITIPFYYLGLRWGIALVGTAVGKPMGFFEAWTASKPVATTLIGIVLLLMLINFIPQLVLLALQDVPLLQEIVGLAMTWLTMMLGISILTTLYGHAVEGRPLVTD